MWSLINIQLSILWGDSSIFLLSHKGLSSPSFTHSLWIWILLVFTSIRFWVEKHEGFIIGVSSNAVVRADYTILWAFVSVSGAGLNLTGQAVRKNQWTWGEASTTGTCENRIESTLVSHHLQALNLDYGISCRRC